MWYKAYDTEFLGLIQNGTLKPMRRPAKVRVLPLKEIASQKSDGRCKWRGCVIVEDRRLRSRLVDGHTHTHSVPTTRGLQLRSFVPLRRGFAKPFCSGAVLPYTRSLESGD